VISAGCGNDACRGNLAGQQIREGAPRLERSGMLEQLQLEDKADGIEAEVRTVHRNHRRTADVRADEAFGSADPLPADIAIH
jgi:hypothetical protein